MRLTGSRVYSRPPPVPKMPPGLVELMEGLTKDVLKNNPPEVYEFCAEHMRKLLEIRDGPTTMKTLSLEQKISRAQEKVRKRAEQRRRKFDEGLQVENSKLDNDQQVIDKKNAVAVDEIIVPSAIKPVHHNDLTQDSEMEISCGPTNTDPGHCKDNDKEILATSTGDKTTNGTKNETTDDTNSQIAFVSKTSTQTQQDDCDVYLSAPESLLNESKTIEKYQLDGENSKLFSDGSGTDSNNDSGTDKIGSERDNKSEDIQEKVNESLSNQENINKSEDIQENVNKSEDIQEKVNKSEDIQEKENKSENSQEKVNKLEDILEKVSKLEDIQKYVSKSDEDHVRKSEDFNVSIAHIEEKPDEFPAYSTISDPEKDDDMSLIDEIKSSFENKDGSMSVAETIANDTKNVQASVNELNNIDIKVTNIENLILSEENEHSNEVTEDVFNQHHSKNTDIDSINDTKESTTDLEKVMNEAIENTKRKDSSADDSSKDNIILNEESDADASGGSNLVLNSITIANPVKKTVSDILIKNEDAHYSKEAGHNDTISEHNDADDLSRSKRSAVDDINTEQSTVANIGNQDNVEMTTEILSNLSSTPLADDSGKEVDTKIPNIDSSNTMDLETAAVTIQKVFRTFLFKSRASTFDDSVNEENNLSDDEDKKDDVFLPSNNSNKERRTLGISRMDTVLQTVNEEKSLSLSTDDSSLSSAATIIQAHVRGFLLRNKLHSAKSASKNSFGMTNVPLSTSLDGDTDQNKSKTILNIHIVPEGGNYLSRDESMITSMDLSLDGSPPSSVNLHPLGYNKSERRKQLKREDAVQSVSPPSNNSGKLSEDSVKELPINEQDANATQEQKATEVSMFKDNSRQDTEVGSLETTPTTSLTVDTVVEDLKTINTDIMSSPEPNTDTSDTTKKSLTKQSSDEMDVVTPYKENSSTEDTKLLHSGEFHDTALPTKVSRSDTPVVSEFKNVLVYFILWNNS